MSDVFLADTKMKLWTSLRSDLVKIAPWFADTDTLLCPVCCRQLKYNNFSVEHVIPQQALANDPEDVRALITKNERSGLTLLCSEPFIMRGKPVRGNGCNGWKGKHFDQSIRTLLKAGSLPEPFTDRHIIALLMVGYLGLFRRFGYRVALTQSGLIFRNQFFNPHRFTPTLPLRSQMLLKGDGLSQYDASAHNYWSVPVSIEVKGNVAYVVIRNYSVILTLSEDPTVPIPHTLAYVPPRYRFRPNLTVAFS